MEKVDSNSHFYKNFEDDNGCDEGAEEDERKRVEEQKVGIKMSRRTFRM